MFLVKDLLLAEPFLHSFDTNRIVWGFYLSTDVMMKGNISLTICLLFVIFTLKVHVKDSIVEREMETL